MNRNLFRAACVRVKNTVENQGVSAARAAARVGVPEAARYATFTPSTPYCPLVVALMH